MEVAKRGCSVMMATAFLSLATPARTVIVRSVCRVSVSGTLVANNLVAPVKTEFLVKLECLATITRFLREMRAIIIMQPAKSMLEKAAH